MKRLLLLLVVVGLGVTAFSGHAAASSLVYLDKSGDIAAAKSDGSAARKLVSNGFTKGPIAVDGKGRIAYFHSAGSGSPFHELIDQEGKHLAGPFLFNDMGLCGYVSPFRVAASPDGTWLAATYIHGNNCSSASFTVTTRLIAADGPTLSDSVYGATTSLTQPRFMPQNQPRLSGIIGGQINVWQGPEQPTMTPWIQLNVPDLEIDSFDYDPARNRIIVEVSPSGNPEGGEERAILVLDYDTPITGSLTQVCVMDDLVASSTNGAQPRYSPDGKMIAWNAPAGIFVSPAPTAAGDTCAITPKLAVPGGSDVEWAPFTLSGSGGNPPTGGRIQITKVTGLSRTAFRKGSSVKVKVPAAGAVKVKATVSQATAGKLKLVKRPRGPVVVASGSAKAARAGTVTVKLRPTAKVKAAWKKLAGARVTLKAAQGSRSATRTVKLTR